MGCAGSRDRKEPIRSDIMEFMIVLQPNDFEATCPMSLSYQEKVNSLGKKLPGYFHCVNLFDVNKIENGNTIPKYLFQDIVLPRVMYIKLPKENIFVTADKWEHEYLKSQFHEIIRIFGILGAKTITYQVTNSTEANISAAATITVGELPVGGDIEIKEGKNKTSVLSGELVYPKPRNNVPRESDLIDANGIYYLSKKYDWQSMCRRRIERRVLEDKFHFQFTNTMSFSASASAKLAKLGIGCNIVSDKLNDFSISFEIEYYPIEENNSNDINIIGDDIDGFSDLEEILLESDCDNNTKDKEIIPVKNTSEDIIVIKRAGESDNVECTLKHAHSV